MNLKRHLPVGAEPQPKGVHLRVWAPGARSVEAVIESGGALEAACRLEREEGGYYSGLILGAGPGALYRIGLDGKQRAFPDPASRFQPHGPHGPSEVIDPSGFVWSDQEWRGPAREPQVIYEMHIGTFTRAGTWEGAMPHLAELAELGVTLLEVMPVADFPGRFGWGYDGVNLFAPSRLYGRPDDFRRFVDSAHRLGMGVILDVVYNHLGPDGNHLKEFSADYFTDRYANEWGEAINFDGAGAGPVREFFISNAGYWIDEFHLDGFRLDATQQIFDGSPAHIIAAIAERARESADGRRTLVIAENESQEARLARPVESGGLGVDALWNDDFHHAARVALTGKREAYYRDYRGHAQEFVSAAKWGYLYQGQQCRWQKRRRGSPARDLPPSAFVCYLQNHDQIANSFAGARGSQLSSPGKWRALTAWLLLSPGTPLLFQGQEFDASSPFLFFADHHPELAALVAEGRRKFLAQFPSLGLTETQKRLPMPHAPETFLRCRLDHEEKKRHAGAYAMHRDLLELRRREACFRKLSERNFDGAPLGKRAFVWRYFDRCGDDRLVLVNLGGHLHLNPAPEPLLAPPSGARWEIAWSSEDPLYGGEGTPELETPEEWRAPAEAAVFLKPAPHHG